MSNPTETESVYNTIRGTVLVNFVKETLNKVGYEYGPRLEEESASAIIVSTVYTQEKG